MLVLGPPPDDDPRERREHEQLRRAEQRPTGPPTSLSDEVGDGRDGGDAKDGPPAAVPSERRRPLADEPVRDDGARPQPLDRCPGRADPDPKQQVVLPRRLDQRQEQEEGPAKRSAHRHANAGAVPVNERADHHADDGARQRRDGQRAHQQRPAPPEVLLHGQDEHAEEVASGRPVEVEPEERDADDPPAAERRIGLEALWRRRGRSHARSTRCSSDVWLAGSGIERKWGRMGGNEPKS